MTKRLLKLIGNFKEAGYDDVPDAPSVVELRGKRRAGHKAEVVAYLRKAATISFSPGFLEDVFEPTHLIGTFTMRTDGTYLWPDYVAGYVERHDVLLPEEFEQHMERAGWRLPEALDISALRPPWEKA